MLIKIEAVVNIAPDNMKSSTVATYALEDAAKAMATAFRDFEEKKQMGFEGTIDVKSVTYMEVQKLAVL